MGTWGAFLGLGHHRGWPREPWVSVTVGVAEGPSEILTRLGKIYFQANTTSVRTEICINPDTGARSANGSVPERMQLGAKHAATRGHKHVAHPAWVVRRQPVCSGVSRPARPTSLNLPKGLGLCNQHAARFSGDTIVVGNPPGRTEIDSTLLYRKIHS